MQLQTMKIDKEGMMLLWRRGGELHLNIVIVSSNTIIAVGNWAVFFLCWVISACIIGAIEAPTEVNAQIVSLKFLPFLYIYIYVLMGYGYAQPCENSETHKTRCILLYC